MNLPEIAELIYTIVGDKNYDSGLSRRIHDIQNKSFIIPLKKDEYFYRIQKSEKLLERPILSATRLDSKQGWHAVARSIGHNFPYYVFQITASMENILIDIDSLFSQNPILESLILENGGFANEIIKKIKIEKEVILLNTIDKPLIIKRCIEISS